MKKWQKKAIEEIMEEFDFKKVHKTMVCLNWKWRGERPSKEEIIDTAKKLLEEVCSTTNEPVKNISYLSTGGFFLECDYKNKALSLSFVVSD